MAGCLFRFVFLPIIIIAALLTIFSLREPYPTLDFEAEGAVTAAFVIGFLIWWAVISWLDMRDLSSTLTLSKKYDFKDGQPAVISGRIEAKEETLKAPFSGQDCVGYCYRVLYFDSPKRDKDMDNENEHLLKAKDYEGFAFAPSAVRGSLRTANILAEPDEGLFDEAPERVITSKDDWKRAVEYFDKTDFGIMEPGEKEKKQTRLIHEKPGVFREDKKVNEPPENLMDHRPDYESMEMDNRLAGKIDDPNVAEFVKKSLFKVQGKFDKKRTLLESVIKEGDEVMISGVFSAAQNGIAPDPDTIMNPFKVSYGGAELIRKKIRNRVIGITISSLLAIIGVAYYYFIYMTDNLVK